MAMALVLFLLQDLESLLDRWKDDDIGVREEATREILRRWKEWSESDLRKLREAQRDDDPEVASRAEDAWGRLAVRIEIPPRLLEAIPGIDEILWRNEPSHRFPLIHRAAQLRIRGHLEDPDCAWLARHAVSRLWKLSETEVRTILVDLKVRAFAPFILGLLEDTVEAKKKGLQYILDMTGVEFAAPVAALLEDRDPAIRAEALRVLGLLAADAVAWRVVRKLADREPSVRAAAALALGWMGAQEYASKILELLDDSNPDVLEAAGTALVLLRGQDLAQLIEPYLMSKKAKTREAAARLVGRLRLVQFNRTLRFLLADEEDFVRFAAAVAIGEFSFANLSRNDLAKCERALLALEKQAHSSVAVGATASLIRFGYSGAWRLHEVLDALGMGIHLPSRDDVTRIAIAQRMDRRGAEALCRLRIVDRDREGLDVVAFLEAGGLRVSGDGRWFSGRLRKGTQVSAAMLLARLGNPRTAWVLDEKRLRWEDPFRARESWIRLANERYWWRRAKPF